MAEHDDLIKRANALGIPTNSGVYKSAHDAWNELAIDDYELHRRIREEERHRREHRLWIVAVIAALAAVASAIGAWLPAINGAN
jgi:ferric-dicitrate binding protein FerR (iron transport regulator)